MKRKILFNILSIVICISHPAFAEENQEKIYLIQMIHQLEALKKLTMAAEKEQVINSRIQFHYRAYVDSSNKLHNGLFEDIHEIEKGIKEKLQQTTTEPHRFQAIKGDYVNIKD